MVPEETLVLEMINCSYSFFTMSGQFVHLLAKI